MTQTIPQIDNGKAPQEPLHGSHLFPLPANTPYGNLSLKWMNIVRRIDIVNLEIRRVFDLYIGKDILEHQFYQEHVIYWLRKTVDELVSLAYILSEWERSGSCPNSVQIDCIDDLTKGQPSKELRDLFKPYELFFSTLNEVSNVFKHSFINTDFDLVWSEYQVVFALGLKRNKLSHQKVFHEVPLARIVEGFSELYKQVTVTIRQWASTVKQRGLERFTRLVADETPYVSSIVIEPSSSLGGPGCFFGGAV